MNNCKKINYQAFVILLLIIVLFSLPYLSAKLLYQHNNSLFTQRTNHGRLVNPPPSLQFLHLTSNKHWLLLYISDEQNYAEQLTLLNQLRLALGENSKRISCGLLTTNPKIQLPVQSQLYLVKNQLFTEWLKQFPLHLQQKMIGSFVISDPHGNVILYYPETTEPKAFYEDLKQLLKASRIG